MKRTLCQFNKHQLKVGTKSEKEEHHVSTKMAKKIAEDHLREFPDYYTHLLAMESKLKKRRGMCI